MKKQVKIISMLLIVMMIVASLSTVVFAAETEETGDQIETAITGLGTAKRGDAGSALLEKGGQVVAIIQTVGIVVAVIVLLVLGIKYMMGSAEEKAEYKKTMIPYVIGAVIIFTASTIVNVIYNLTQGL